MPPKGVAMGQHRGMQRHPDVRSRSSVTDPALHPRERTRRRNGSRRPTSAAAWLVVTLALVLGGCGGGGEGTDVPEAAALEGSEVVVIGDSLMDGAAIYGNLQAKIRGAGHPYVAETRTGMRTAEGVEHAIELIEGREPGHLVIGLGTNDEPDGPAFAASIDALVEAAPGWRIWWVAPHHEPVEPLEATLQDAGERHQNLEVVDFAPVLDADPTLWHDDGIHLTPRGYEARADFVVEFVEGAEA